MKEIKGFYTHLAIFILVNLIILIINIWHYSTIQNWIMSVWTFIPCGVGLGFHAINVFGFFGIGKQWEKRKIQEYLDKQKRNS